MSQKKKIKNSRTKALRYIKQQLHDYGIEDNEIEIVDLFDVLEDDEIPPGAREIFSDTIVIKCRDKYINFVISEGTPKTDRMVPIKAQMCEALCNVLQVIRLERQDSHSNLMS